MKLFNKNEVTNNDFNQPQQEQTQIINELKNNKMETKIKLPYGIKQPTTVEEFRENLKKYYITHGNDLFIMNGLSIPLEKISNFDDIYKITKTGLYGLGDSPSISPKVLMKKDIDDWMVETNQLFSFNNYFLKEENYEIIEEQDEFIKRGNPTWWSLDNQIMREFYIITLGDYCGYVMNI